MTRVYRLFEALLFCCLAKARKTPHGTHKWEGLSDDEVFL